MGNTNIPAGIDKQINKKHINSSVKDDWMSQVCWKPVKFADVKDCGKRELLNYKQRYRCK